MIVVSFYTKNTSYEKEAEGLIASCERLSLPYDIEAIDSLGTWDKNCCQKPSFLLRKLQKHKQPIVWVDADAVILKKPTLFDNLEYDIAAMVVEELPMDDDSKILSGTLYCNNTPQVHTFLQSWHDECQRLLKEAKGSVVWDQAALRNALTNAKDLSLASLPPSYAAIFDCYADLDNAVIVHCQASRYTRSYEYGESFRFTDITLPTSRERASHFLASNGRKRLEEMT